MNTAEAFHSLAVLVGGYPKLHSQFVELLEDCVVKLLGNSSALLRIAEQWDRGTLASVITRSSPLSRFVDGIC